MRKQRTSSDAQLAFAAGCSNSRIAVLTVLLLLGFVGLGVRLVQLQWFRHGELRAKAESVRGSFKVLSPVRGRILDRKGTVLATSTLVKTIIADPSLIGTNAPLMASVLAPHLKMSCDELTRLLEPRTRMTSNRVEVPVRYVVLKKKVSREEWGALSASLEKLDLGQKDLSLTAAERKRRLRRVRELRSAIGTERADSEVRIYPCGSLAAHVVGFTLQSESASSYWYGGLEGRDGVERTMNHVLSGIGGWRESERYRGGRENVSRLEEDVAPRSGMNVVLTIDAGLQQIVETELEVAWRKHTPVSACCVVVRPRTGEILALANLPTFDPNHLDAAGAKAGNQRNRIITDQLEPGSTFKVLTISGALDAGVVDLDEVFDCENGKFQYGGGNFRDEHAASSLPVRFIVAKSSNIGAAKIGIRMGDALIYDTLRRFGLGQPTGIELPGESRGRLYPTNQWRKVSKASMSIGYAVGVTRLQMAMAFSAVANGGRLMKPRIVDHVEDDEGNVLGRSEPTEVRQVVRPEAARKMVEAMKSVVVEGTGRKAQLECYPVAGKTGTARKIINKVYSTTAHLASFIGFFPADDPELCIAVFVDEPDKGMFGGDVAAPVFQAIAEKAASYLGVPVVTPPAEDATRALAQAVPLNRRGEAKP